MIINLRLFLLEFYSTNPVFETFKQNSVFFLYIKNLIKNSVWHIIPLTYALNLFLPFIRLLFSPYFSFFAFFFPVENSNVIGIFDEGSNSWQKIKIYFFTFINSQLTINFYCYTPTIFLNTRLFQNSLVLWFLAGYFASKLGF